MNAVVANIVSNDETTQSIVGKTTVAELQLQYSSPSGKTLQVADTNLRFPTLSNPNIMHYEEKGKEEEALGESGEEAECSPLAATREMVEMMRQAGRNVPEHLSDNDLLSLQEHTTKTARKKFLKFLALKESYKKARKQEKEKRKSESQPQEEEEEEARVSLNSYLITKRGRYLNSGCKWRAAQAMLFGQSLVFDMSYEAVMNQRELSNTISQLQECLTWNKRSLEPFHIHFCNLQPNSGYKRELTSRYGDSWDNLLITATEQRHVDMFPHKQLVYLTADSPNVLRSFDHNKVYIVGALVDKADQSSVSLTNAKRLKLDTARFPLDHFLQWDSGAKNLTLDQVMRILLTLRDTGKWEQALEFVPKRKHSGFYPKNLVEGPVKMFTDVARMKFKKRAKKFTFSETGSVRDAGHKPLTQPGVRNVFKPKQFMEPDGKAKGRKNWGG
ncbi:hypothetical protein COCON_G00195470 [Conger conger]|uniref:tRNA methyltransferase 10 homolog C n=1 Tax=Conger conger TaxID=82655 RepID=A0A9Q1D1X0_CONCO|nr:hypothetical protein COCON_G00195470 [Conger conger]